jgi:hypothetical protein
MVEVLYLQTVLAVMPEDDPLWRELTYFKQQLDCRRITGEDVLGGDFGIRRTQIALVAGMLEHMDKHVGSQVLARLRDLYCSVLNVLVPMGDRWSGLVSRWESRTNRLWFAANPTVFSDGQAAISLPLRHLRL